MILQALSHWKYTVDPFYLHYCFLFLKLNAKNEEVYSNVGLKREKLKENTPQKHFYLLLSDLGREHFWCYGVCV